MGYRDDSTALKIQLEVLERETGELQAELDGLREREEQLRRTIARKRLRLKLHRTGRWLVGHPKTSALLLILLALIAYAAISSYLEHRAHQQELERRLAHCASATTLEVRASHRGQIYVSGLKLGLTPQKIAICPGSYQLQVIHRHALPWQQIVNVLPGKERLIEANLVPWRLTDRPAGGLLFFSDPAGALLFVNGAEVGRTPIFLRRPDLLTVDRLTLALVAPGFPPHLWTVPRHKPGQAIWLHMQPAPSGARDGGGAP